MMRLGSEERRMILVTDSADPLTDTVVRINVLKDIVKNPHHVVVFANK